eukprot:3857794-Amphidinium_carterae.1
MPTRRLTRRSHRDPVQQRYVQSTSTSPIGRKFTGYEPKSGDQQEHPEEEDMFTDPGPEAAERYALHEESSSNTGPRGNLATGVANAPPQSIPEFDISG